MTRRDYELVAESIEATVRFYSRTEALVMQRGANQVAYELADKFAEDNKSFDKQRFLKDCGVE
jgi:hypothetical protein